MKRPDSYIDHVMSALERETDIRESPSLGVLSHSANVYFWAKADITFIVILLGANAINRYTYAFTTVGVIYV